MVVQVSSRDHKVAAGEFKARCLQLMDQVCATRQPIVITKRGRPVAKLIPMDETMPPLFGRLKGHSTARDDLIEPTGEILEVEDDVAPPHRL
jgi:prevent-host-death family protein